MAKGVAEEYSSSLADLTVNSKPLINMLTMLAEDYLEHAPTIVRTVEAHLTKVPGDIKLPVLYLIDSIVKNVGKDYVNLFTQNIVSTFCSVFEQVDEKTRSQMFKLRQTWNEVFPAKKLYALDARVNSIDPAWPITAAPPSRIHVNPLFLSNPASPVVGPTTGAVLPPEPTATLAPVVPVPMGAVPPTAGAVLNPGPPPPPVANIADTAMREELLKKRKELLELQKRKVELELLQTKAILEEQQKKLENQTATRLSENPSVINPKIPVTIKQKIESAKQPEPKVDKPKLEVPRRRDPRLHSRRDTDTGNSSKKDSKLFTRDPRSRKVSPGKATAPVEYQETPGDEADIKTSSESKKFPSESSSTYSSSKHEKRKSDRHKKHKDYKPRKPKMPFSSSSETKEKDYTKRSPKKSKQDSDFVKSSKTHKEDTNSQSFQNIEKTDFSLSENKETLITKSEHKEEKMEVSSTVPEPTPEIGIIAKTTELPAPPEPPLIMKSMIDLSGETSMESVTIPAPMEIDDKPEEIREVGDKESERILPVFKIKDPTLMKTSNDKENIPLSGEPTSVDLPLSTCGDTDLRLLPPQPNTDSEQPPEKKSKPETLKLFGEEDVDLRQTLVPIPPPPPIISKSESWANIKRSNSDKGESGKSPKKRKSITSPRSSLFRKKEEDLNPPDNVENETEDRQNSLVLIMKEAEEQLKNETITYAQYNQMLKGVMSMNEESKLKEALRKDDYERIDSPESSSNSSTDVQQHFDPASPEPPLDDKSKNDENLPEKSKSSIETGEKTKDHEGRRRSRYKNNEPYSRSKSSRRGRYYGGSNEAAGFDSKPWLSRQPAPPAAAVAATPGYPPHRLRKDRWGGGYSSSRGQQQSIAPPDYPVVGHPPPPPRLRGGPRHHHSEVVSLPPADPAVLDLIDSDPMTSVTVGNSPKAVRFYGENAIVMLDWNDPRDLLFQPGSRRVFIDGVDVITLQFNAKYREYTLDDGLRINIRLGAPTRELFIDGRFFNIPFGGPPLEVHIGGRGHLIQLEGPLPFLNIGTIKRTDLVAGRVNLIVDAKIDKLFPIYLDSKPQKFEIKGIPFILRFVDALQTVVINGQPMKSPFGDIPVPIFFRGERHFLRLTTPPPGITPGFVSIVNMEGGLLAPGPGPRLGPPPPAPVLSGGDGQLGPPPFMSQGFPGAPFPPTGPPQDFPPSYSVTPGLQQAKSGREAVAAATPAAYQVEPQQQLSTLPNPPPPAAPTAPVPSQPAPTLSQTSLILPNIDVIELYQKLVAMGVVPNQKKEKEEPEDDTIKPVDFSKPETLKVKQPGLINVLYSGIQCSSCGVRFSPEQTVKYSQHLDWHFRQNRRERHSSRIAQSRKWNYDVSDWIQYQEIEDDEDRAQSWFEIQDKKTTVEEEEEVQDSTVPASGFGENPCCTVCRDRFDQFFNEEKEEWQLRRAVCVEDKLYHPLCLRDEQESQTRQDVEPVLMPVPEPAEEEPIVTIDLDAVADSGEDDTKTTNLETIEIESTSKSPQEETEEKEEIEEKNEEILPDPTTIPEVPNIQTDHPPIETEPETNPTEETTEKMEEDPQSAAEEGKPDDEEEKEAPPKAPDYNSDDDILDIKVIEPHIESYDILDDDDDEELVTNNKTDEKMDESGDKVETAEANETEVEEPPKEIVIKTEPIDLVNTNTNTNASHINETIYLDGNSEFSAPTITLPKRIKINISSVISKNHSEESGAGENNSTAEHDTTRDFDHREPLPPGEEEPPIYVGHLKPALVGRRLLEIPPVSRGKEMSGLCSIM